MRFATTATGRKFEQRGRRAVETAQFGRFICHWLGSRSGLDWTVVATFLGGRSGLWAAPGSRGSLPRQPLGSLCGFPGQPQGGSGAALAQLRQPLGSSWQLCTPCSDVRSLVADRSVIADFSSGFQNLNRSCIQCSVFYLRPEYGGLSVVSRQYRQRGTVTTYWLIYGKI